jgi:hypothetical protein
MRAQMVLHFFIPDPSSTTGQGQNYEQTIDFPSELPNDPALIHKTVGGFAQAWMTSLTEMGGIDPERVKADLKVQNDRVEREVAEAQRDQLAEQAATLPASDGSEQLPALRALDIRSTTRQ